MTSSGVSSSPECSFERARTTPHSAVCTTTHVSSPPFPLHTTTTYSSSSSNSTHSAAPHIPSPTPRRRHAGSGWHTPQSTGKRGGSRARTRRFGTRIDENDVRGTPPRSSRRGFGGDKRHAPQTPGSCTLAELRKLLESSAAERTLHEQARASMSAVIVDLQEKLQSAESRIAETSAELRSQDNQIEAIALAQSAEAAVNVDRLSEEALAIASDRAGMTSRIASLELDRAELTKKLVAARTSLQQHRDELEVGVTTHAATQAELEAQIAELDAAKRTATVKLSAMQRTHAAMVRKLDEALARESGLTKQMREQSLAHGKVEASLREQLQIAKDSTAKAWRAAAAARDEVAHLTSEAAQAAKLSASLRSASNDENSTRSNIGIVTAFTLLNKLERERSACACVRAVCIPPLFCFAPAHLLTYTHISLFHFHFTPHTAVKRHRSAMDAQAQENARELVDASKAMETLQRQLKRATSVF